MPLTHLKSPDAAARWLSSWVTGALRTDSRQVQPGDAFIAWPGYANDGRQYVKQALERGAATCLVEREGVEAFGFEDARVATLPQLKAATGLIASAYYRQPSGALRVIATTGTNGKTSTAWWTAQCLTQLGTRCGVVGTLGIGEPPVPREGEPPHPDGGRARIEFTGLTTPDPVLLQQGFRRMADEGFGACAIEASSIGIVEHRLAGTAIEVVLFTNFTRDHLDYHGDMEAYWAAKRELFGWPGLRAAVINVDDAQGAKLVGELAGKGLDLWTISTQGAARLRAADIAYRDGGLAFDVIEGTQRAAVASGLIGDYNVNNLLVVIGGLRALGVPLPMAASVAEKVTPVPGRMQRVLADMPAPELVVDYAHTPDALEKVLLALRPLAEARGGALWCVFGCGGNRDASKRPLMGEIAAHLADRIVVTSDNPRREPAQAILDQIVAGIPHAAAMMKTQVEADRRVAILEAVAAASEKDVVLIAGKGHEDYQEIDGVKHPFSDAAEAAAALKARLKA
ncbi:UDP-N-acetylmuramoyl-L-alanyl-D-glutamate--2,6-diaminopimelate ligase [Ideonella sp.]|uniref:UDP-N-acetylmuramoyl-L-alanyl-D-glutamate--2, 6-diaminopimelate ligase n=1 Tax=Ideonella sp. TaxID=1929293 RepID=UPI002B467029|nr:UDP-N-acetylmuramoyl-L-alanyl-D-glutamate--2,6-diaminopimelate ligase [Ideonella sp.]HJV69168.1 UDP-N-acetylmuramoyl-L-alanyl-D-glutamate--2,6-diaminopimelate ligase [Ideonella sp.]